METVRGAPDVRSRSVDSKRARQVSGVAHEPDRANVLMLPRRGQRCAGRDGQRATGVSDVVVRIRRAAGGDRVSSLRAAHCRGRCEQHRHIQGRRRVAVDEAGVGGGQQRIGLASRLGLVLRTNGQAGGIHRERAGGERNEIVRIRRTRCCDRIGSRSAGARRCGRQTQRRVEARRCISVHQADIARGEQWIRRAVSLARAARRDRQRGRCH